ncbi:MAG: acylphosphatase [Propionicimonas sp.]|nr:acylphosphatase [Propionicimonas sp.]
MHRAIILVDGRVQGVGFRWWAADQARQLRLAGHVRNLDDGRVELLAQGELESIAALVHRVNEVPTTTGRPGWVTDTDLTWHSPQPGLTGFWAS